MGHPAPALFILAAALGGCTADTPAGYQGYVEGEYVHVAPAVAGRLDKLLVRRGQVVEVNAPLFRLEADTEGAARQQAEDQLKAAQAHLADLKLGRRKTELNVVDAQLAQAVAAQQQAQQQLERDEAQFAIGGIARAQRDDSRTQLAIKAARVRELSSQLEVSRLPARDEQIRAQEAQVAAARAVLAQASWRFDQTRVAAADGGLVVDTLFREGEWVAAGAPVVRLLPPAHVKVRFFVPQAVAGGLKLGRSVVVRCDGCGADVPATVSFIATEAEYTPPVIYSNETRAKLVFMVEAQPAGKAQPLRPGQPVSVSLQ
ncbi:MAG TPA: HlyD family efflux transporter periplasmic adaptor subunit [Burkholderiaceae bacterium]|nr:HlyD family efflux transporter periplasmic adaptor subunit [Burkholderiaceae bacterium]